MNKARLERKVTAYIAENREKLRQWYSDRQMDQKIRTVAKKAGAAVIYPVLLLYNLLNSPQVRTKDKMYIVGALAYFILPADLIPDFLFGIGFIDDGIAIMTVLKTLSSAITPSILEQTRKMCDDIFGKVDDKTINSTLDNIIDNKSHKG